MVKWAVQNKQRDWSLTYGAQFNTPKIRYTFINLARLKIQSKTQCNFSHPQTLRCYDHFIDQF